MGESFTWCIENVTGRYFLKLKFPSSTTLGSAWSSFFKPNSHRLRQLTLDVTASTLRHCGWLCQNDAVLSMCHIPYTSNMHCMARHATFKRASAFQIWKSLLLQICISMALASTRELHAPSPPSAAHALLFAPIICH